MEEKLNHIHTTPLAFPLTICWLVSMALPHSHSQPPPPPCAEQSYRCNISVSSVLDPFWEQIPQSQCNGAHASSGLICHVGNEFQNFTVKKVNHTSHTMTVVPTHTVNDVCSQDFFIFYENLNNSLLQYYESVHNVTVFLDGCPELPGFPSKRKIMCWDGVYYFEEGYKEQEMLNTNSWLEDCNTRLHVATAAPLHQYDDNNDGAGVLEEALRDGFEVYYALPPTCTRCSLSDGSCWSHDGFVQILAEDVVSCKYCPDEQCSPPESKGMCYMFSISLISYISLPQNPLFSCSLPKSTAII